MAGGSFIGRDRELRELQAALDGATAGSGKIVMLVGEPGIGKSRTAQELATRASEQGALVLWGRCYESSGAPPYWPWIQIVRSFMTGRSPEQLRDELGAAAMHIAEVVPELREQLPDLPRPTPVQDPELARFRLFDSVTSFLKEATREVPVVLILDNLHAADKPSLLLLEFLSHEIRSCRLLVVGTYRDVELTRRDPLSETLSELAREGALQRLVLRGLPREDVGRFIEGISGILPPEGVLRAVHDQTEGNPLFLGEVVRLLVEEGVLAPEAGESVTRRPLRIPEGVRQAIGRRLNRLSEGCVQTLTIASVIGREFALQELQQLIDHMSEDRVVEVLEEALAAHVIEELPNVGDRYQFSHILIRETLHDELAGTRRHRLHRRIGEALEDLHQNDIASYLPRLAYHFQGAGAGDWQKALDYSVRAAERALALFAYEQASGHYEMALEAMEGGGQDEHRRCDLLLALGDAQAKAAGYPEARNTFWKAAEVARSLGSPERLITAAIGFEGASWPTGTDGVPAARLLEEALLLVDGEEVRLRAMLLGGLARAYNRLGLFEQGVNFTRQADAMARASGDLATFCHVLRGRSEAFFMPQMARDLLPLADDALSRALETGAKEMAMETLTWSLLFQMVVGDERNWDAAFQRLEGLAQQFRQPFYLAHAAGMRATLAVMRGRFQEAERLAQRALDVGARVKGVDPSWMYGLQMFTLRREQGRLHEVAPALTAFLQRKPAGLTWRPGLAAIYSELGREAEARAEFELLAEDDFKSFPQDGLWPICLAYLSEACCFLGDGRRAAVLYQFLQRFDGYCIYPGGGLTFYGAAARYLGMLAATMTDWTAAARHFEDALVMDTKTGARTWLAHGQHEYAKMLLARRAGGDRERAVSLMDQALATTREFGMRALEARLVALDRQAQAPPASPAAVLYPDDLTQREVEVLRLLAAGMTNQGIAHALFISASTVAHHVSNIMSKIGAANRTAAANYAHAQGLV